DEVVERLARGAPHAGALGAQETPVVGAQFVAPDGREAVPGGAPAVRRARLRTRPGRCAPRPAPGSGRSEAARAPPDPDPPLLPRRRPHRGLQRLFSPPSPRPPRRRGAAPRGA